MSDQHHSHEDGVELPVPTAWPITAALGLTLVAAGLVTNLFISLAGILIGLTGAIGWFRDVFPIPDHEIVPFAEPNRQPDSIKVSPRRISHLAPGNYGHRAAYPFRVHRYSSGIRGGIAGGVAMAFMAMLYGLISHHSIWFPINLLAAAGLPSMTVADTATLQAFHFGAFMVAVISHGTLSVLIGMLYTVLLPMLPSRFEWFWGGIIIPLIWTALFAPIFDVVNPALAANVNWVWFILCQLSFGLVGGFVVFKSAKVETMQSWSIAERLGVHAMEGEDKH